jgi:alpha-galactosidase
VCFGIKDSCASDILKSSRSIPQQVFFKNDILQSDDIPFSFTYGGQTSSSLLSDVNPIIKTQKIGRQVHLIEKVWRCKDGLVVTLRGKSYTDYSAVEWITYFTYEGKGKSKLISDLYGIDNLFRVNGEKKLVIHSNKGDDCTKNSYEPYDIVLEKGQTEVFYPGGEIPSAKSTTGKRGWPYWNIQNGSHGWIIAVGWPGAWQNEYSRGDDDSFRVRAGQKTYRAFLYPGETVRTPLICVLPWKAPDVETAQNHWRHFYLDHIIPRFDGEPEKTALEIPCILNESRIERTKGYFKAGINPRICWNDANDGWYPTETGSWEETGEWRLAPSKYPNGIKPFSDWAHQHGMECLLWFEPERVMGDKNTRLYQPDWLLTVTGWKNKTLNLANPDCLNWLINHISNMISDNGLDWYREDLNYSGPYHAWVQADAKMGTGRQGITENLYVQGHLAYWDSLKQRHPGLHIDACASGGRRNDLETMHRAVPLLRSDYQFAKYGEEYIKGNQAHTWALSSWFPYQGSSVYEFEPYKFRSFYLPCFGMGYLRKKNEAAIIQGYTECKAIQPMMLYGDYWPLTPYSLEDDEWIAWQFNRENEGDGCIQVFRRGDCDINKLKIKLRGLDPQAYYLLNNFDRKNVDKIAGKKLMKAGYIVRIDDKPGSAIIIYEKIKK